jgi:hypothetical protein
MIRTITAPDGEAVLVDAGYDGEVKWIRENLEAENAGLPDNEALFILARGMRYEKIRDGNTKASA